ncbi:MAG: hypothetical protein Kow00121_57000 [Elainellaceae cyanobacterium]
MKIDIIDDFKTFQSIRSNWDSIYETDPQAQFFLSWIWLDGVLQRYDEYHEQWFILAAKPSVSSTNYVAFFPLRIITKVHSTGELYNELLMAGVTDSEHIGFICLPEFVEAAGSAFALFLQQQEEWSTFQVEKICKIDNRLSSFLKRFGQEGFEVQENYYISDLDEVDNNIVPYISLPETWEQYLQNSLSTNTRQKLRRFLRKIEGSDEFRLTQVNAANLEQHLEILTSFWKLNWGSRRGSEECQEVADKVSFYLRHCFQNGCLYLPVFWQGGRPLGAIANLIDFNHKTMLFFVAGRDDTVKDPPSGIILHAYSIKYAIENGFKIYDFLMGNEAYKFSFGAKERRIKLVLIQRKCLTTPRLNPRTISQALQISSYYHRANQLLEAEQAYRQVLAVQPHHPDALYGLGVVMQRKGEYLTAETLFKTLLQVQPNDIKTWFSLGTLYQMQNQLPEAENAYQQALTLQPESSAISLALYHNLGYTFQQQSKWEEAIVCYQKARELQPDSLEAEVIWANALYAQKTLPSENQARYAAMNYELGNKRSQAGDSKVAIEYYRQAIAMNPELAAAHYHLGLALQAQGEWEEAIVCYQTAQALQPDYLEAEVHLANARYAQGMLLLEQQVYYAEMNQKLGNQCQQTGNFKAAIEYFQQAVAMNPNLAEAYYQLGLALEKQGNQTDAIVCYQKAQALRPDYVEAEVRFANALHAQKKLNFEDRVRYAVINCDLGHQYKQAGDLKRAIEYYQQAISMNPDLTETRDHLRLTIEEQDNVKIKVSCAKR